eukprot:gene19753-26446_t
MFARSSANCMSTGSTRIQPNAPSPHALVRTLGKSLATPGTTAISQSTCSAPLSTSLAACPRTRNIRTRARAVSMDEEIDAARRDLLDAHDSSFQTHVVQWYPGHIARAERQLREHLKMVDAVLEIRDARIPVATSHPQVPEWCKHKLVLQVMNRVDEVSASDRAAWMAHFKATGQKVYWTDGKKGDGVKGLKTALQKASETLNEKRAKRGLKPRAVRACVIGFPNIGKSALINRLIGRRVVDSAAKPGVTRGLQWVRLSGQLDMLDAPGVIPASFVDQAAYVDSLVAAALIVRCKALPESRQLIDRLIKRYNVDPLEGTGEDYIQAVGDRMFLGQREKAAQRILKREMAAQSILKMVWVTGALGQREKAAQSILKDYRTGALGPFSLELPDDGERKVIREAEAVAKASAVQAARVANDGAEEARGREPDAEVLTPARPLAEPAGRNAYEAEANFQLEAINTDVRAHVRGEGGSQQERAVLGQHPPTALEAARDPLQLRTAASSQASGRQLKQQIPSSLSQCKFNNAKFPARCEASNTMLLQTGVDVGTNFAGRAVGFALAGDTYCAQFSEDDCAFPCSFTDGVCGLDATQYYGAYACPGSEAMQDALCSTPDNAMEWCSPFAGCILSWSHVCNAEFKLGMDISEKLQWMGRWSSQRRSVWGCCEGSNALWSQQHQCAQYNDCDSPEEKCGEDAACRFTRGGECEWAPAELMKHQFNGSSITDHLVEMSNECDAIADEQTCENYKPVDVDVDQVMALVTQTLKAENQLVDEESCLVWR